LICPHKERVIEIEAIEGRDLCSIKSGDVDAHEREALAGIDRLEKCSRGAIQLLIDKKRGCNRRPGWAPIGSNRHLDPVTEVF
jgi:hypothetical protein